MPRERQALDAIVRLVAASVVGFDGRLFDSIRDVLLGAVELDGLTILLESDNGTFFRVEWQSFVGGAGIAPLALGEKLPHSALYAGFTDPPSKTPPLVALDSRQREADVARSAAKLGILSYVLVPVVHEE